jgi:hypothetical protein
MAPRARPLGLGEVVARRWRRLTTWSLSAHPARDTGSPNGIVRSRDRPCRTGFAQPQTRRPAVPVAILTDQSFVRAHIRARLRVPHTGRYMRVRRSGGARVGRRASGPDLRTPRVQGQTAASTEATRNTQASSATQCRFRLHLRRPRRAGLRTRPDPYPEDFARLPSSSLAYPDRKRITSNRCGSRPDRRRTG